MTINQAIADIIIFVFVTLFSFAMRKYAIPFVLDKHLAEVAKILVKAAESLYGAGHGDEKFAYCIEQINTKYGIKVDVDKMKNAIEAAWLELNAANDKEVKQ